MAVPPLNHQNLHRIKVGMKLAEVIELLGQPPGDYQTTNPKRILKQRFCGPAVNDWISDSAWITVMLEPDKETIKDVCLAQFGENGSRLHIIKPLPDSSQL